MKSLRLLAISLLACAATTSVVLACDANKGSATSATTASTAAMKGAVPSVPASGGCSAQAITYKTASNTSKGAAGCTAEMAAQCTPAMREACMKNAAAAAAMGCTAKGVTATTASHAKGAGCSMHGTSATTATTANMDHCAAAKGASAVSAGMKCSAHQSAVAHDCAACEDWMNCEQDVRAIGAKAQVVSLKNGAMIVYTADSNADVKALQSTVAKRNERMVSALSAGSDQKLCDECKQLRGAMASGKLHREVVNVERGCMTLITSNDRSVVQKIRAMTGQPVAMR